MDPHLQYRRLHDDDTAETDSGPLPRFSFELTDQSPRSLSPGGLEVIATNEVAEESPYKSMVNRNTPLFHEGLHVVEDDDNLERGSYGSLRGRSLPALEEGPYVVEDGHEHDGEATGKMLAVPRPAEKWWRRENSKRRLYLEAGLAGLVVVGIVVGAVVGTQEKHDSSRKSEVSHVPEPNDEDIPIGTSFNASFAIPSGKCVNECGLSSSGYTVGVSQNLYGNITSAAGGWACGTCWSIVASPEWQGQRFSNTSDIVVQVNTLCPANPSNNLCQQKDLDSLNEHNATVHFNLCPEAGTDHGVFGDSGYQLGYGTVRRVECPQSLPKRP